MRGNELSRADVAMNAAYALSAPFAARRSIAIEEHP
jgi:hypothetical protein